MTRVRDQRHESRSHAEGDDRRKVESTGNFEALTRREQKPVRGQHRNDGRTQRRARSTDHGTAENRQQEYEQRPREQRRRRPLLERRDHEADERYAGQIEERPTQTPIQEHDRHC